MGILRFSFRKLDESSFKRYDFRQNENSWQFYRRNGFSGKLIWLKEFQ